MKDSQSLLDRKSLNRAVILGIVLFIVFAVVAGALWALGSTLGLGTVVAFLLAACGTPFLVGLPILIWVLSLPLDRRRVMFGVTAGDESSVKTDDPPQEENLP